MYNVGVDYHPSFQQIAFLDQETGKVVVGDCTTAIEKQRKFYRALRAKGLSATAFDPRHCETECDELR